MEEMEQFTDLTSKKSHKGLICGIIIVLLLGVIGFGYYYKNKPEVVFKTATMKVYKALNINKIEKSKKVDFDFALNVNMDGNKDLATEEVKGIIDIVNNLVFKFSTYNDLEKNVLKLDLSADYKKKELLNIGAYYEDSKIYLDLNDLYDKIIYDEVKIDEESKKVDEKDVKIIIEEYFKALEKGLSKAKYETEKVDLNGSKVTRNKLIINEANKKEVYNTMIDYLVNNSKFIKALSNVSEEKEAELKKNLSKEVELPKLEDDLVISIYTKGFNNDIAKISLGTNKSEIMTIVETSKDNYEIKMGEAGFEFKCNVKVDEGKNIETKCSTEIEKIKIGYTMNIKVDDNYKLEKPEIKKDKLVKFSSITEEDTGKIMEKLTGKDAVKELMGSVGSIMEQFTGNVEVDPVDEPIEEVEG